MGLFDKFRFGTLLRTSVTGKPDQDIHKYYEMGSEPIGSGRFGVVYNGTHRETGEKVAIKTIRKKKGSFDSTILTQEIDILSKIDNERTLKLVDVYEDGHSVHIVCEWLDGGELFDRIIALGEDVHSEASASNIMREICMAVKYLHGKNITHRDLKPENIMFRQSKTNKNCNNGRYDNNNNFDDNISDVVLVDFGMSCEFVSGEKMSAQVGSPSYVAPEVLNGEYDESADMWSLGVILYILLSGEPPFHGDSPSQTMRKVREGEYDMDQNTWRFVSESGKKLVLGLMEMDPKKRLTITEVLSHEWWDEAAGKLIPLPANVATSITEFQRQNQIKRKTISIITKGISDLPEFDELRASFQNFDKDNDGIITVEELGRAIKTLEIVLNSDDLESIVNQIDQDMDGRISFEEFLAAVIHKEMILDTERLKKAFDYFDVDKSGKIDVDELFAITGDMDEARKAMKEYDIDNDGAMNFMGEFQYYKYYL
jgi:calcium-dependent protein kinase